MSVDEYVQTLLERTVTATDKPDEISLEEFERDMDALAEGLEDLVLPYQGTHSREDIYFNHD